MTCSPLNRSFYTHESLSSLTPADLISIKMNQSAAQAVKLLNRHRSVGVTKHIKPFKFYSKLIYSETLIHFKCTKSKVFRSYVLVWNDNAGAPESALETFIHVTVIGYLRTPDLEWGETLQSKKSSHAPSRHFVTKAGSEIITMFMYSVANIKQKYTVERMWTPEHNRYPCACWTSVSIVVFPLICCFSWISANSSQCYLCPMPVLSFNHLVCDCQVDKRRSSSTFIYHSCLQADWSTLSLKCTILRKLNRPSWSTLQIVVG